MAIWESTKQRLAEINAIVSKANMEGENDVILDIPPAYCPVWTAEMHYEKGVVVSHGGVKYLIIQAVDAQEHYPPDMPNGTMLAIYKPYQGRHGYDWLYGEYSEAGFTRFENGVLYEAIQDPGANIYPPSQVPAVWAVVEDGSDVTA